MKFAMKGRDGLTRLQLHGGLSSVKSIAVFVCNVSGSPFAADDGLPSPLRFWCNVTLIRARIALLLSRVILGVCYPLCCCCHSTSFHCYHQLCLSLCTWISNLEVWESLASQMCSLHLYIPLISSFLSRPTQPSVSKRLPLIASFPSFSVRNGPFAAGAHNWFYRFRSNLHT